MNFRI